MSDDPVLSAYNTAQENLKRAKIQAEIAAEHITFARHAGIKMRSPIIRQAILDRAKKHRAGASTRLIDAQREFDEVNNPDISPTPSAKKTERAYVPFDQWVSKQEL